MIKNSISELAHLFHLRQIQKDLQNLMNVIQNSKP